MMKQTILFLLAFLCIRCSLHQERQQPFTLQGAWQLSEAEFPAGQTQSFPSEGITYLRIYEGDSIMYQCRLTHSESALVIQPSDICDVKVIDTGDKQRPYLEDGDPFPLTILDDTTITIQQGGILYTWCRTDEIAKEWKKEICEIISDDLSDDHQGEFHNYVLSSKDRQQENMIHWFICFSIVITIVVIIAIQAAIVFRREKRKLRFQLQQIQDMQENRPQVVRQAVETMEKEFFASDDYITLQRRIAGGQLLKEQDWLDIEAQLKRVYPAFSSQLHALYPLSELEYQVCMLIKLRIAPTDIASVMARSTSTISTMRSRLYTKVFGRKGGAKEWDEFLQGIGV
jgi:hypothetical protein